MSNPIWLTNLIKPATGTNNGGKYSLDVHVAGGTLTTSEGATAADGGALPAVVKVIGGYDGTNVQVIKTLTTGELALGFSDQTATGTITSTESVTLTATGLSSAGIVITGAWTGTVTLEASVDGVNFTAATGAVFTGGLVSSNFSSNNSIQVNVSAFAAVRIRGNTVTSGTATVYIRANSTAGPVVLTEALPQGGNVIGSVSQSGTWTTTDAGFTKANAPTRNDYTSVNVTTAAYVQLVASTTSATKEIEIFDSSGQLLVLATGAAASEVDQIYIMPGGNGRVKLAIPASTRVSVKAVSATASVGQLAINWYT